MLDDLLLLRLWAVPEATRGETRSRVAADLRPAADDAKQGGAGWQTVFAQAVTRLAEANHLTASGRGGARLVLSDLGRTRALKTFHLPADGRPAGDGRRRTAGWAWWRDHYALPLALEGAPCRSADELRTALLRRLYLPDLPKAKHAESVGTLVDLLLAKRLAVSRPRPAAFRRAVLRGWVNPPPSGERSAPLAPRLADDPALFAAQTLAAARRSATGRFGDSKVFISHVWRGLLADGHGAPEQADEFKQRLVRANTAGLLRLSRADLAGAHADEDVRASEIHYLGEKFHFVRVD